MNIQPLYDQVIVSFDTEQENVSEGGIVIASQRQQSVYLEATVVACGNGHLTNDGRLRALTVKVGDRVLVDNPGTELKHEGDKYGVLRERDILGIIG